MPSSDPSTTTLYEGIILGAGNPLLDISAHVSDDFLTKYNLEKDNAILYEKEDIYDELLKSYGSSVEYLAGGATQNTMRVTQWILGYKKAATYMGSVGRDGMAEKMKASADVSGLNVYYQYHDEMKSGKCAVLITGQSRSLVTKLDAANHLKLTHIDQHWDWVEKAKFFYSSGYFLTVCPEGMVKMAQHALDNNKTYILNFGAPFLSQFFFDPLIQVLSRSSMVIGNEEEATAFATKKGYADPHNMEEVALAIAKEPFVSDDKIHHRTVIITRGADTVICVEGASHDLTHHKVIKCEVEEIVDTNGAGDAFVGGFLAQLVLGKDIKECIKCGVWAATVIIKRSGCTFPDVMEYV